MLAYLGRFIAIAAPAACIASVISFSSAGPAWAQNNCGALIKQRAEVANHLNSYTVGALKRVKAEQIAMQTTDRSVADEHLAEAVKGLATARKVYGEDSDVAKVYEDQRDFWQAKRSQLALGIGVGGGDAYVQMMNKNLSKLEKLENTEREQIAQLDQKIAQCQGHSQKAAPACKTSIVGTWNWWNGYTVTFNANGGATYRGSSLARSGVGRWQKTGGSSYHVHWLNANTNDYFTLSSDGLKLEGTYDGKPGVSTRKC